MPSVFETHRAWTFANKDTDTEEGRAAAEFGGRQGSKLPARAKNGKTAKSRGERRYDRK